jgi:ABC-2 type transport system permease protein
MKNSLYWSIQNTLVLIQRSIKHIVKNPDQLLGAFLQPIMFTILFRYVFGGAIEGEGTTYVNFLMAGILIQTVAFGATITAINLAADLQRGFVDRLRSLPIFAPGLIIGHIIADTVRNLLSAAVMLGIGYLVGFRPTADLGEWLMVTLLIIVFSMAISSLSSILGLLAKSVEAVQWMTFLIIFPLTFVSSAFVPTSTMPAALRIFADNQPITQVIGAVRAWLVGTPIGDYGWKSFLWCFIMIAVSIPVTIWLYRRRSL